MAPERQANRTADGVILDVLVYEFPFDDPAKAHRAVRRRLRDHGLGPYRQERVDLLRRLKDEVQAEVGRGARSRCHVGSHGRYAASEDFDVGRLAADYGRAHPGVARADLEAFWRWPSMPTTYADRVR